MNAILLGCLLERFTELLYKEIDPWISSVSFIDDILRNDMDFVIKFSFLSAKIYDIIVEDELLIEACIEKDGL